MPKSKSVRKGKSLKTMSPAQLQHRKAVMQQAHLRKELRKDPIWDDCTRTYQQCAELLQMPKLIQVAFNQEGVAEHITNPKAVTESLEILTKDNKELSDRLMAIYKQHEHKKGQPSDMDDALAALEVQQNYLYWMELHSRTVTLMFNEVMEHLHHAELAVQRKLVQANAAQQAQDPDNTDPIDVVVKNVATA